MSFWSPVLIPASGQEGSLVKEVLQVRPAEAGRAAGYLLQVHVLGEGFISGVDLEDLQPILQAGQINGDVAVEATGPQQGGIEDVGSIRGWPR
jgi:hypothetical protein